MTSLLTSLTKTNAGGQQFDFVETFFADLIAATSAPVAQSAYLTLVRVGKPLRITTMTCFIGTASGNIDMGIYTSDGTNYVRQASIGATAAAGSSAVQSIALTAAFTMVPGVDYWLAFLADNATVTIGRLSNQTAAAFKSRSLSKASVGTALPATNTLASWVSGQAIWLVAS